MIKRKIPPPSWITAPETQAVLSALTTAGGEARFVGGCVRDALLGRTVADIDIATTLKPNAVITTLQQANLRAIPTGLQHGTVTTVSRGQTFEITTLRRDVRTDGRHAKVVYTNDWRADAARRDFTMNALFLSPDGTITDFFDGLSDVQAGRVRFVGAARQRIKEDGLRLLRFFRFHAWYGRGKPEEEALSACAAMAVEVLPHLAAERVRVELLKLLSAPNPVPALNLMQISGIFPYLSSASPLSIGAKDLIRLQNLIDLENRREEVTSLRRLTALLYDLPAERATAHAQALRLSKAERGVILTILNSRPLLSALWQQGLGPVFFQWYAEVGPDRVIDAILLAQANGQPGPWEEVIYYANQTGRPSFPLKGRDALTLGLPPGPKIGETLATVKTWWIHEGFRPDYTACLKKLQQMAPHEKESPEPTPIKSSS